MQILNDKQVGLNAQLLEVPDLNPGDIDLMENPSKQPPLKGTFLTQSLISGLRGRLPRLCRVRRFLKSYSIQFSLSIRI